MFGHVKGAFTDARADRIGRFELAEGGTLLLDEIGTLEPRQQAKLLRVLESGEVERVGASRARRIDVRILSATNADLAAEVAAGRFREDLLFRLNTIEIHLPPLRERRDDIGPLARALPRALRRRATGSRSPGSSPRRCGALESHAWPGNVRELDHTIERAVLMAQGTRIRAADLGLRGARRRGAARGPAARGGRARADPEGARAPRRQREPGGQGARAEPERALPPAAASWALTGGVGPPVTSRGCSSRRCSPALPAVLRRVLAALGRRARAPHQGDPVAHRRAAPGSSGRRSCGSAWSGRCRRSPTCSPRCARGTTRSAPAVPAPTTARPRAARDQHAERHAPRRSGRGALEATALLRRVMEEIDVAIFAFDGEQRLRLVNRGGERLLGQPAERLLGLGADALGLAACLDGETPRTIEARISRRHRAVGAARQYLPAGRAAAPAAGALRPEPRAPRGGALGVAADRAGAGPRDQQLARADQVDRRQPPEPAERPARPPDWEQDLRAGCS